MQITHIGPDQIYHMSGESLLQLISSTVEQTVNKLKKENRHPDAPNKHKLNTDEAAAYLGIKKATLYIFVNKYKMKYEKGRPSYFTIEELQRVEEERRVRPH